MGEFIKNKTTYVYKYKIDLQFECDYKDEEINVSMEIYNNNCMYVSNNVGIITNLSMYIYIATKAVQDSYETGTDTKTYATANESKSFYEYSDL